MKQILLFLIFIILCLGIKISPININDLIINEIKVTVKGEVENSGELTLPLYSSIQDALNIAIVKDNADLSQINPQTILKDKDIIIVPSINENTFEKVSINNASKEMLCTLNGIGESIANRIIEYRNENGLFQNIEDLMEVKGIGQAKFEKIKDYIKLWNIIF